MSHRHVSLPARCHQPPQQSVEKKTRGSQRRTCRALYLSHTFTRHDRFTLSSRSDEIDHVFLQQHDPRKGELRITYHILRTSKYEYDTTTTTAVGAAVNFVLSEGLRQLEKLLSSPASVRPVLVKQVCGVLLLSRGDRAPPASNECLLQSSPLHHHCLLLCCCCRVQNSPELFLERSSILRCICVLRITTGKTAVVKRVK